MVKIKYYFLLSFVALALGFGNAQPPLPPTHNIKTFNRSNFPPDFVFGSASSSYQNEGAANEGGKGPSIWDTYTKNHPERIDDHSDGIIATDSYHRYKEDVRMLKQSGFEAYRFSISWPRLIPRGKRSLGVNEEGIRFYNNLINELQENGLEPYVTLFHWDLPQALEDEYGGLLSSQFVNDYRDFADLCFSRFGDRVKHWITFNEPWSYAVGGYASGFLAPGRCSAWQNLNCTGGNSSTEPYIVAHNMLVAHGVAVQLYRNKYQESQKGKIGITLVTRWILPYSNETHNRDAARRALDFNFGWFMHPITYGKYPDCMYTLVKERLPSFSEEETKMLRGSFDFIGLNYYTANYARHYPNQPNSHSSYERDSEADLTPERNGIPIGKKGPSGWLYVYPRGIRDLLVYIKRNYTSLPIYITENGVDELNNSTLKAQDALNDSMRVDFYFNHLLHVNRAIQEGVNVKGYFAWALMDNFEWKSGYSIRFGINYVDYKDGLKRYPKLSAKWFSNFLRK
ncbi:hypothetical protein ACH5RR_021776 [Cinchona calisaya]|uniref:Beta-glucosidase 12-like n=1 Tax=Cinchona calisaya TaxID=153742 RepID=A0ABD2ZL81_9GENT